MSNIWESEGLLATLPGRAGLILRTLEGLDADIVLLRAPPGSGKTVAAVAYAIREAERGRRTAIFVRTRKEVEHVLKAYWFLVGGRRNAPLLVPLSGRESLCRFPPEDARASRWWCAFIECEYRNRRFPGRFAELYRDYRPDTLKRIVYLSFESGGCPLENVRSVAADAPIIVATYPFLINPSLRESIEDVDNIVIDEAHGLMQLVTYSITARELERGEELCRGVRELNRLAVRLWLEGRREEALLVAGYANFSEAPGTPVRLGEKVIKVLPPAELIGELGARRVIVQSATLFPRTLYETLFRVRGKSVQFVSFGPPLSGRPIVGLNIGISSAVGSRDRFLRMAPAVIRAVRSVADSVLVFLPSYELAEALAKELGMKVSRDKIEAHKGIVIAVARGMFSEGIDLSSVWSEPDVVLALGIPFPKPGPELGAVSSVYASFYGVPASQMRRAMMVADAVSALAQSLGRVGRRGRGVGVIVDSRVPSLGLGVPILRSLSALVRYLRGSLRSDRYRGGGNGDTGDF